MTLARAIFISACFMAWLALLPEASACGDLRRGWVELHGPLEPPLFFDIGSEEVLRIAVSLRQGETRRFDLVLPANGGLEPIALGGDSARVHFGGFERIEVAIPPGLRVRAARPPVSGSSGARGLGARRATLSWIGLVCAWVLVFALLQRRKPLFAVGVGLVGGIALSFLGGGERAEPPKIQIEDGEAGGSLRILVDSGFERLSFPSGAPAGIRLDVLPTPRSALWTLSESSQGEGRIQVEAPGARVNLRSVKAHGGSEPTPDRNPGPAYEEVWTRDSQGSWAFHGPWAVGEALPQALAREGTGRRARPFPPLPTWLASGLPQGRSVFIAREKLSAPEPGGGARERRWLRLTDF